MRIAGDELFYEGCSDRTKTKYAGGFVWQRNITSHYSNQGMCIPYHRYRDQPDTLAQLLLTPENPRNCKYASRHVNDDDALGLVEQFLGVAVTLKGMSDTSEDWLARIRWLQALIAELWKSRGLYPGLPQVLTTIGFEAAIPFFRAQTLNGKEQEAHAAIFAFLDGSLQSVPNLRIDAQMAKRLARQWRLRDDDQQVLLRDVLPRLDLDEEQMLAILDEQRSQHSIYSSLSEIATNPYILAEEYVGDGPDDIIPWSTVDRGVFPSPELGGEPLGQMEMNDWRRFRSLCVERMRRDGKHTFLQAARVIHDVNRRLSYLPEWKQAQYTERYLDVDEEDLW